jgi:hypothetical protein
MVLAGRIVKREEKSDEPMADITYLIGVTAQNLGKQVGDTLDLVPLEHLRAMKAPDWALTRFRARFPHLSLTNEELGRLFAFWHKELLPKVLRGRRY